MRKLALALIRIYQYAISPLMAYNCRFYPSCSCYAFEVIENIGLLRGVWLSFRRLVRCNPWSYGGYDPAPLIPTSRSSSMAE